MHCMCDCVYKKLEVQLGGVGVNKLIHVYDGKTLQQYSYNLSSTKYIHVLYLL